LQLKYGAVVFSDTSRLFSSKPESVAVELHVVAKVISMTYLEDNLKTFPQATGIPIILGSSSSNRKFVLNHSRWHYDVIVPDIDEKAIRNPDPYLLPLIIAKAKAAAILSRLDGSRSPFVLLTADQIVLYGSEIREKPIDEAQAREFLLSYSEREVSTVSAVVATHYPSGAVNVIKK
jgi:Maf-like protein